MFIVAFFERMGGWSLPFRLLLLGVVVTGAIQVLKMCVPLLNGWMAFALNLFVSAVAVVFVNVRSFGEYLTAILLVSLTAAGIHGTATKLSDFPNPRDNPTPSGTPAQNYDKIDPGPERPHSTRSE